MALAALTAASCRSASRVQAAGAGEQSAFGQFLVRAEVTSREERGSLRITLRRWRDDRFDLTARDLAGRSLWRLEVDGALGRLEGVGRERRCRLDPSAPIALPRLALPLSAAALPDLLLGRSDAEELAPELVLLAVDGGLRLTSADGKLTVAWRVTARAALAAEPVALDVDPSLPECRELDLSS